jgi:NAD(P)H-hydrate epimerase
MINDSRAYVIAVDIPSGLDATNGKVLGACVKAEETVTFIARKRGMACGKGPEMCGEVVVSDLGIPNAYEIR